jgi:hypothetical protein
LIFYAYIARPGASKTPLWNVLLLHAFTGFFGSLIENVFIAKSISNPSENWSILLGLNEANWIFHESTTGTDAIHHNQK